MADNTIRVRDGDCPCPGRPHEVEIVTLLPKLTLPIASAALAAMNNAAGNVAAMQGAIVSAYLPAAITEWTFLDEDRKPVEITQDNLELLLPWDRGGLDVSEACDALYSETLMRPLVARFQRLSQAGSTESSTSPSLPDGYTPPPPLRQFSLMNSEDGKPSEVPVP